MQTNKKVDSGLNLIDVFSFLASKWKWFLLSVLVFGSAAWLYYARKPFVYFRSATVIIKDPSNKTTTAGFDRYDNYINKVNVANEILQFRSKRLMREVVQRMHGDVDYLIEDGLRNIELYTKAPVTVSFPGMSPSRGVQFKLTMLNLKEAQITTLGDAGKTYKVQLRDTTAIGNFKIAVTPTNFLNKSWIGQEITVRKNPLESVVSYYSGNFAIRQEEDESSILTLALRDFSPERAEELLNTMINVYNEEAIEDKNQVAINTANFINERLIIIEKDLGVVESDLETFKSSNQLMDVSSTAGMYMSESQKYGADGMELETQLRLAQYIKEYLIDPAKETDLIPANTGLSDASVESQINTYNELKLRRDKLIDDSSDKNPVVEEMNNSLRAMKQNIVRAVDNLIVSLNVRRRDALSRETRAQVRFSSIPKKERKMLSIERQQKIKESLYMFLLNRREENALTQAMADNNARLIDEADKGSGPIAPVRNRILILGLLAGIALPGVACLLILFLDTRVHGRKDLEGVVTAPLLGEIPLDKKLAKKKKTVHGPRLFLDKQDDIIAEAFRILRTNMAFMAKKGVPVKVITFTSFREGAGKTFILRNLAVSLMAAKKKVVVLDLDIRKRTLSRHFAKHPYGMTNYLSDASIRLEDILVKGNGVDIPDAILAGPVAPNPAELLLENRLDELIEELKTMYDYVIVDNVPIGIIADASIANRVADLTLFVVRAGSVDRRLLPEIEDLYENKKLNNMAVVLNAVEHRTVYGYGYGYSYQYKGEN